MTDRDEAANAPNTLFTLLSPRTDTPTTLHPVVTTELAVAHSTGKTPAQLAEPITDPSVTAFVQVAVILDLKMTSDPAQRAAIREHSKLIVT